jgi:predicted phage terminase large subunit-like protein
LSASTSPSSPDNPWLDPPTPRNPRDPFLVAADLFDPPAFHDEGGSSVELEAHQRPPAGVPGLDWFLWLLLGGRGAGKTQAGAAYMHQHATGPPCLAGPVPHRMAIIAPTLGDASESCVNGPSGLRAYNPAIVETTRRGGTFVNWPNGSQARLFGAYTREEPERLRAGGNRCMVWMEEVAAWRYLAESWKHIRLGLLRLGETPHAIATTTPRNRPTIKTLIALARESESITHATTADNAHLPSHIRQALYRDFAGTRLGRQELEGEMIEDVEGALWSAEQLERCRIREQDAPAERQRVVVAIDPSWGTTNDEVGIIAGFRGPDDRVYVLEDLSGTMTPSQWGERAAKAYERLSADLLIAEGNFQGEQVRLVMKTTQQATGLRVNFKLVTASRGKVLRAEPVVALYEQGRVLHVGRHVGLEYQMTHWVPPRNSDGGGEDKGDPELVERTEPAGEPETSDEQLPSDYSPDRVDALVFLVTELLLGEGGPATVSFPGRGAQRRMPSARGRW